MSNRIVSEDKYTNAPADISEEIRTSVLIPDNFPTPEELRHELKRTVTIRLDPDVYEWFRLPGAGYQTRINAVLRAYMNSMQTRKSNPRSRSTTTPRPAPVRRVAKKATRAKSR